MSYEAAFKKADELVKNLPKEGPNQSTNDEKLQFYSLYKQATVGDCTGPRPGMMDFTGKYKYDAWKKIEGMSKDEAQKKYVELLESKLTAAGDADSKKGLEELAALKP